MPSDIRVFNVLVGPGGSATAPNYYNLTIPARDLIGVEFVIPSGTRGSVQFGLAMAGTVIIPANVGGYITGDDEVIRWPLDGYPNSGAWQLAAFNTGTYTHNIQVRFLLNLVSPPGQGQAQLLSSAILSG